MGTADLPDGVASGDAGHVTAHEDIHDFLAGRAGATNDLDIGGQKITTSASTWSANELIPKSYADSLSGAAHAYSSHTDWGVIWARDYIDPAASAATNQAGWASLIAAMPSQNAHVIVTPGTYAFQSSIEIPRTKLAPYIQGLGHPGGDPNASKSGVTFVLDSASPQTFFGYNFTGGAQVRIREGPKIDNMAFSVGTPSTQKGLHTMVHLHDVNHWIMENVRMYYGAIGFKATQHTSGASEGDNAYWVLRDFSMEACDMAIEINDDFDEAAVYPSWSSGIIERGAITATSELTNPDTKTAVWINAGVTLRAVKVHNYGIGYHWPGLAAGRSPIAYDLAYECNFNYNPAGGVWKAYLVDDSDAWIWGITTNWGSGSQEHATQFLEINGNDCFVMCNGPGSGFDAAGDGDVMLVDNGSRNNVVMRGHVANFGQVIGSNPASNQADRGFLAIATGSHTGSGGIADSDFPHGTPPVGTMVVKDVNGSEALQIRTTAGWKTISVDP